MVDFIRKSTKKSLLSMLRRADKITPRLLAKLFEGVLFKDEYETFSGAGGIDHGSLGGLADDDHTRYLDKDGTRELTGDWDVGAFDIRAADLTADAGGVFTDTITELVSDAGVTIDGVLNKDSQVVLSNNKSVIGKTIGAGDVNLIKANATDQVRVGASAVGLYLDGSTVFVPNGALNVDTINELTGATGVTIDGVLFLDGNATFNNNAFIFFKDTGVGLVPLLNFNASEDLLIGNVLYTTIIRGVGGVEFPNSIKTDGIGELTGSASVGFANGLKTDTISERIGGSGVTVDSVLLQDGGATLSAQFAAPVTTQTDATLTLTGSHYTVLCDGTSNTVTITLPTASGCTGRIYSIKAINIDNAVTVDQTGAETIDDSTDAITLDLMEVITVQSDGTNWWII